MFHVPQSATQSVPQSATQSSQTQTGKFVLPAQDIARIGMYVVFNLGRAVGNEQSQRLYYCFNIQGSIVLIYCSQPQISAQSHIGHLKLPAQNTNFPVWSQTANQNVARMGNPIPGRKIVYCLKTMARRSSSMCIMQSYQFGRVWPF